MKGYEEYVNNEVIPIYAKESVKNGDIWANISSVDFWSTEGADGLGFLLSMFVPGVALGKLGLGTKLLSQLGKVRYGDDILKGLESGAGLLGYEAVGATSAAGSVIDVGLATTVNTIFEAGSEANGIINSIQKKKMRPMRLSSLEEVKQLVMYL